MTRLRLTGLIRRPGERRVLLLRGDRTWRPPRVVVRERTQTASALAVVPAFERRLGTRLWLLRQLRFQEDEERGVLEAVQELELVDDGWHLPRNGRWAGRDDLDRLRLEEADRDLVAGYLDGLEDVPAARAIVAATWRLFIRRCRYSSSSLKMNCSVVCAPYTRWT